LPSSLSRPAAGGLPRLTGRLNIPRGAVVVSAGPVFPLMERDPANFDEWFH